MPKYTVHYTHFAKVEIAGYKHIEAKDQAEAEKLAKRYGAYFEFDEQENVDKPYEWEGHCRIYDDHKGWEVGVDEEPLAEGLDYSYDEAGRYKEEELKEKD